MAHNFPIHTNSALLSKIVAVHSKISTSPGWLMKRNPCMQTFSVPQIFVISYLVDAPVLQDCLLNPKPETLLLDNGGHSSTSKEEGSLCQVSCLSNNFEWDPAGWLGTGAAVKTAVDWDIMHLWFNCCSISFLLQCQGRPEHRGGSAESIDVTRQTQHHIQPTTLSKLPNMGLNQLQSNKQGPETRHLIER